MEPLWIGACLIAILLLVLLLAYLFSLKEQSFEDAVAIQKAGGDIFSPSKNSGGKAGLKQRKKTRKDRPKVEEETKRFARKDEIQVEDSSPIISKSLEEEAKSLFEAIPEKPTIVVSSDEEKPVQKTKKKSRDKRKSDDRNEMPSKEQEAVIVKDEVVVEEAIVNTNVEPILEGLPPVSDELPPKEASPKATGSAKKSKKSKGVKEKQLTAGIYITSMVLLALYYLIYK